MDWLGRAATGPKAAGMRTSRPSALGLSALLATSSVAALLIGTGAPPAYAVQPCEFGGIAVVGASQGSVTNSAPISCIYISNSTINGSVTNAGSGAITTTGPPSSTGITVNNSTVTGAVSNAGTIAASGNGIAITGNASIGGGIGNSGMLSVGGSGIVVNGPSTFAGGISNSGAITASGNGINVGSAGLFTSGIVNSASGTITATRFGVGVLVGSTGGPGIYNVSNFGGGVSNAGSISSNSGTGIQINGVSTFGGGIANSGTISGSGAGIRVEHTVSFVGSIVNAAGATISGGTGIEICNCVTSFLGGITSRHDSGCLHGNSRQWCQRLWHRRWRRHQQFGFDLGKPRLRHCCQRVNLHRRHQQFWHDLGGRQRHLGRRNRKFHRQRRGVDLLGRHYQFRHHRGDA
jgi:hypothetical protein